jgi:4-hydroxy-4-methyl-2-oxoglutarate aldolase
MSSSTVGGFDAISPTTLADVLGREQVMDIGIRPLWSPIPRVAGPAFTVRCPAGDNLMLHAAIYRAEPGSIVVVESGDTQHALAGGNDPAGARLQRLSTPAGPRRQRATASPT